YAGFQRAMPAQPGVGQQAQRHQGGKQQRGSEVQDQPGNADIEQQQDDQRAFDAAEGVQDQADQDQVAGQGKRRQFRDIDGFAQVQDKEADGAGGIGNGCRLGQEDAIALDLGREHAEDGQQGRGRGQQPE